MFKRMRANLEMAVKTDPAVKSKLVVFLTYPGFHALCLHSIAHFFYNLKLTFIAQIISQINRFLTSIEIHPAVKMGQGIFIDHGVGVVIGETAELEGNIVIYQGVTLGGTGKNKGKRHPSIKSGAVIGAGAKVLGPITIGENAKIGAGSVVLTDIPKNATAVGVPAQIKKTTKQKLSLKEATLRLNKLQAEINKLKSQLTNNNS